MTFLTPAQFLQIGKKCSMCEEKAKWFDKFDEKMPAYCDKHFPGRICECEICEESLSAEDESFSRLRGNQFSALRQRSF